MRFKALLLSVAICLPSVAQAELAGAYNYSLGDSISKYPLDGANVIDSDMAVFGGQQAIKMRGESSTEVALTFLLPDQALQYIEHDWVDRNIPAKTALGLPNIAEFTFGITRVADIQATFGEPGFHYACRQQQQISGGILSFISFSHPSRPDAIYTFILEYSQDLFQRGLVDIVSADFKQAVLVAVAVSRPIYIEDFWCAERIPYTAELEVPAFFPQEIFNDFLPPGLPVVETDAWEVSSDPLLMISKNGAQTWGDRLFIIPDSDDCSTAEIMVWAHTDQETELLALKGQVIEGAFNVLLEGQIHGNLKAPIELTHVIEPALDGSGALPFAIGSFVFGPFDIERIIAAEDDPTVFGFSLEFPTAIAGLRDNYWSLEGLSEAGVEAITLCRERQG